MREEFPPIPPIESAFLGAIIMSPDVGAAMRTCGVDEAWLSSAGRAVWDALGAGVARGGTGDLVQLAAELTLRGNLSRVGGAAALAGLVDSCPHLGVAESYAAYLGRLHRQSVALGIARDVAEKIHRGEALNGQLDQLAQLATSQVAAASRNRSLEEAEATSRELDLLPTLSSPLPGLDDLIGGGYKPGRLVLAGAFSGEGKTTYCIREAVHHAIGGHPVLYISTELGEGEVARKIASAAVSSEGCPYADLPIKINDSAMTIEKIEHDILEFLKDKTSPPVIVIDYLQRIRVERENNRERQVAVAAETLQTLTRTHKFYAIAAAQFNRQSQRETLGLHHFRESGLLEQVADIALLLDRVEQDQVNILLAKNRYGQSDVMLSYAMEWETSTFLQLNKDATYLSLAQSVASYMQSQQLTTIKTRDLTHAVKSNGRHPKKFELQEASKVGLFSIEGSNVTLTQEACQMGKNDAENS